VRAQDRAHRLLQVVIADHREHTPEVVERQHMRLKERLLADHPQRPVEDHPHRHSGIGLYTPASVHYGTAAEIRARPAETLDAAYTANPCRFGKPTIENDAQKKS